jgi:hypothetical protein
MTKPKPLWQVATLQGVRLLDLRAHNTVTTAAALSDTNGIQLHYEAIGADDHAGSRIVVTVKLSLHLGEAYAAPESAPLFVTARYEAIYGRPASAVVNDGELQDFAQRNAMLNVWPAWRELVQSLFGRLDLALPPLPRFQVPAPSPAQPSPTQQEPTR